MNGKGTIRFEDLGEPVQRLLKSLKSGYSEEDMALLEFVSVKDMAKIYGEMSTDRHAEEIWEELRDALRARKEKAARREMELLTKKQQLEYERDLEERKRLEQEAAEAEEQRQAEEARRLRREARRKRREEEAAAAEAAVLAEQEAAAEAAAQAEEEERLKKAEKKRKRREARARELLEEQEAIAAEEARQKAKKLTSQKKDWEDYVADHPLEFSKNTIQDIEQKNVQHTLKAPPAATKDLLNRTYTPKCPNCGTRFPAPPIEWDCPLCLRRHRMHIKVWQPDDASSTCMRCQTPIGKFSRHHCRSCGRLVCTQCSDTRAVIMSLGFKDSVKVCDDCAGLCAK